MSPHRSGRWLSSLALLAAASCAQTPAPAEESHHEDRLRGAELFAAHCAACHGERGAGNGPAYPWLFPPPRDFTSARFRLVSTVNGAPSDADLVRTLRRGMPGSAMPSFGWMSGRDLELVAARVRELGIEGAARRMRELGRSAGSYFDMRNARLDAEELLRPGPELKPVHEVASDEATLSRGRDLYVQHCAGCHSTDGTGDRLPRLNEDGTINWARDFTAGFLKGGAGPEDLSWRILAGIPGSAMPPTVLSDQGELQALVAHVRELIPPGTDMRLVHGHRRLVAHRTSELPVAPDHPAWSEVEPADVVLAPLHWGEQAILGAELSAFHDGRSLALRVRWNDPTGETRVFSDLGGSDGCAVQLSAAESPPLFGMGSTEHPTNLWHWKALRLSEVAGLLDVLGRVPHAVGEPFRDEARLDAPIYHRELGVPPASTRADSLSAEGVEAPRLDLEQDRVVQASPRWFDGSWEVVFVRALAQEQPGEIVLEPGSVTQVAVAVWNGAAGDHKGQKSISVWHAMELEP